MSTDLVIIIRMHRLSILFHHIVGNVYQIIDRTDSACCQPSLHPLRRRLQLNILHHPGTITGTQSGILNLHGQIIMNIFLIAGPGNHRGMEFFTKGRCRLPGQADHTVAVHTVGGDFIFKYHIMQSQYCNSIRSYRGILRQNINSQLRSIRIHLTGRTQLLNGTHHTVGFDSPQLALFNPDPILRQRTAVVTAGHLAAV